jgi:hypothetical protein
VKPNEALDPVNIGPLGAEAVVLGAETIPHLIEQFWGFRHIFLKRGFNFEVQRLTKSWF